MLGLLCMCLCACVLGEEQTEEGVEQEATNEIAVPSDERSWRGSNTHSHVHLLVLLGESGMLTKPLCHKQKGDEW